MIWVEIALAFMKMANIFMTQYGNAKERQAGREEEVARQALAVLQKTEYGKHALEEFRANPGSADDFLRSLEPKSGGE